MTGLELKELRLAAGLTQQELAQRASCSLSYISTLEQGRDPQDSRVLPRILAVLSEARAARS